MLKVTKSAVDVLRAAKDAAGAPDDAGIRIRTGPIPDEPGRQAIGFAIANDPDTDDEEFEQEGLRIFVEDTLVDRLDGRTLDVREEDERLALIFR